MTSYIRRFFCAYLAIGLILNISLFSLVLGKETPSTIFKKEPQLKRVVILMRHGIRSPNKERKDLNLYAAQEWPKWPVKPGQLSPHGFKLIVGLGEYFRKIYDTPLGLTQKSCSALDLQYSRTDNAPRSKDTTQAFLTGFFPTCALKISSSPSDIKDPYFFPTLAKICIPNYSIGYQEVLERIGSYANLLQKFSTPLALLQEITGCCHPTLCEKIPCSLLDLPGQLEKDGRVGGPFSVAQGLIEDIYLEKAQGFPKKDIGWGKIDDAVIAELDPIHVTRHDLSYRTPYLAKTQGSSLAALIFASIKEAINQDDAPPIVLLSGHDNNVDNIGALYGLTWTPKTYAKNQVPPASGIIFELYYYPSTKKYTIRSYFFTQTLDQMANLQLASQGYPPEWVPVKNEQCSSSDYPEECTYEEWSVLIQKNLDQTCIPTELQQVFKK